MKVILIEPFGHREGHPSVSSPRYLSQSLVDIGVDVTLVTFAGMREDSWLRNREEINHISVLSLNKIFLRRFLCKLQAFILTNAFLKYLESFLTVLLALREWKRQKYDVIHILDNDPFLFFPLFFALFLKNCNFVITFYGLPLKYSFKEWAKNFGNSLIKRDYRRCALLIENKLTEGKIACTIKSLIYRRSLKGNKFSFICQTENLRESFKQYMNGTLGNKVFYIPLGVGKMARQVISQERAREYLGLDQEGKLFLCFGTNHPGKDLEVIFRAIQMLPKNFKILFAGKLVPDANRDPSLLAQKCRCLEKVIVVDQFVPEEEKPYYFSAADAAILSYRKDFQGSTSILNDTAKFALPVIVSNLRQNEKFVKGYNLGLTFRPEDPDSLCKAISYFLNISEEEKMKMKSGLKRFALDYSWERIARKHLEVYGGSSNEG